MCIRDRARIVPYFYFDGAGSIEIKVWDYSGPISSADEGNVVKIRGTVSEFRGTPQITVDRIRLADDNDTYDLSALVPVAPIDVDTTKMCIRDSIRTRCLDVINNQYKTVSQQARENGLSVSLF